MVIKYNNLKCSFCNTEDNQCVLYSKETLYSNKTFICKVCLSFDKRSNVKNNKGVQ